MARHGAKNDAESKLLWLQIAATRKEVLGENHPDYANSLERLADIYRLDEQFAQAEPLYKQALAIQKQTRGPQSQQYAVTLFNLGCLYYDQREFARAEPLVVEAVEIIGKLWGSQHPEYAKALDGLASVNFALKRQETAEQLSREALQIVVRQLDLSSDVQTEQQQLKLTRYVKLKLDRYLTITRSSRTDPDALYAEVLAWKGMVWARQLQIRRMRTALASDDTEHVARLAALQTDFKRRFANLSRSDAPAAGQPQIAEELAALQQEIERLEKALASASAAYRRKREGQRPTAEMIRQTLPPDGVLVDFLEYWHQGEAEKDGLDEPCLVAFVVRPGRPVVRVDLGPMEPISTAVDRWRRSFGAKQQGAEGDPGQDLRQRIWQPLTPHIQGAKLVLVSPDEGLNRLPFAALPAAEPGKFLIEELAIAVAPVPHLLPELLGKPQSDDQPAGVLLVGDVDFDGTGRTAETTSVVDQIVATANAASFGQPAKREALRGPGAARRGFEALPGSALEIATIRDVFARRYAGGRVTELRGVQANEDALFLHADRHRFLHLATHGFFAPPEVAQAATEESARPKAFGARADRPVAVRGPTPWAAVGNCAGRGESSLRA